jgi:hypothetical protein
MKKPLFKNWKTTLIGIATAVPFIIEFAATKDFQKLIEAIGIITLGYNAKDHDVTGI